MSKEVKLKNLRGKGRKVTYTIQVEDLEIACETISSFKLILATSEVANLETDEERAVASINLLGMLIGQANFHKLVDWLEVNCESLNEETEVIGQLSEIVFEKVLPKAQAQA